jgi:hypothetical protein
VARSPAEIQAQIRLTRRAIDSHLEAVNRQTSYGRWAPYALLAGAAVLGLGLSRLPLLRVLRLVSAAAAAVLTAVHAYDAVRDRFVRSDTRRVPEPAPESARVRPAVPATAYDDAAPVDTRRRPRAAAALAPRAGVPARPRPTAAG